MQTYIDYINTMSGNIMLGCDGFVDEVYEIVEVRRGPADYTAMDKLKQFGELLVDRADGGVGVELVAKRRCEGGFGINTGRIAGLLGLQPKLPGLYGAKEIDSAFAPFADVCDLISLGDPALTIALEFGDGKVLMSDLAAVSKLSWADFEARVGAEALPGLFTNLDIIGLGYWSLTANFEDLFRGFMAQYEGADSAPPKRMFFDFADIKKKSAEAFTASLELIKSYNDTIPAIFSLNEHEVFELCSRIGVDKPALAPEAMAKALTVARETIGFAELVVHTPEFAAASSVFDGEAFAIQDRQDKVVRLAGAGDSFNGGYLCASLGELSLKQRLVIANATTAFFVTHGNGPTKCQLIAQLEAATDK